MMNNDNNTRQQIVEQVFPLLLSMGIRSLTMDKVAHSLGISKRTLYEQFDSKEALLIEVLRYMHRMQEQRIEQAVANAGNAMESMALSLRTHREIAKETGLELLRDMDETYPRMRLEFESGMRRAHASLMHAFEEGVKQGVFRESVDYRITLRLFFIQMESLKRMERYFPPDVTLDQAITAISVGLLRSIATPRGMEILEKFRFDSAASGHSEQNQ